MAVAKKAAAKKAAAKKSAAKKTAAKKTAAKQTPAKKTATKQTPAKQTAAKQTAAKKTPAKKTPAKKTPAKKTPAKKAPAKQTSGSKAPATKTAPKRRASAEQSAPSPSSTARRSGSAPVNPSTAEKAAVSPQTSTPDIPAPRGVSKDGIAYTKDFDVKFLKAQRELLEEERSRLLGQAMSLEDEAHSLIEEAEMGDVQFDDEGGEGDTMVVERERDLALSAQARQTIADIDAALERIKEGSYGYSMVSGQPIPRERLEAIPWATELVQEKVGGIGRR